MVALAAADIWRARLSAADVKVEILGFRPVPGRAASPAKQWLAAASRLARAGSMTFATSFSRMRMALRGTKRNLALMIRGPLKENIDGEALAWGITALLGRPEQRAHPDDDSDGATVDDPSLRQLGFLPSSTSCARSSRRSNPARRRAPRDRIAMT